MMIAKLFKDHKAEMEQMESEFSSVITKYADNEKILKEALELTQKKHEEIEKEKEHELNLRIKTEDEFNKNMQTHEEEVQLRLKFESKLNNMHALHRDLQAKYERALEDIYTLEYTNGVLTKESIEQKKELTELRSDKIENESKITY